jgi:hypothetical protein
VFTVTMIRTGHISDHIAQDVQTSSEALILYLNEVRDLLDQGFTFGTPDGMFPAITTYAVKGRTTVRLSVSPIADR